MARAKATSKATDTPDMGEVAKTAKLDPQTAAKPVAKPIPKPVALAKYVCVLTVRENSGLFKAGEKYEGEGLKNKERLAHLLKRGAIKVA